ncbi:unnamed protein product [Durusdinium trenchii]|uniref:Uncharacterized protein n=1 Tax=Durusdinium trenchii TaxID=1381693 RepID=A0ABP0LJB3_9DINO
MNRGTSQRSACSSSGFGGYQSVRVGNMLLERTCCLILLATALGGAWSLEQPSGSLLEFYPVFREMLESIFNCGGAHAVSMVQWWMAHYSSATPKRHYAYGNSEEILRFDKGRLEGWKGDPRCKKTTVDRYRDSTGAVRYKGNRNLRGTEVYPVPFARLVADLVEEHKAKAKGQPECPDSGVFPPALETFQSAGWHESELWEYVDFTQLFGYLRGGTRLKIPEEWRPVIPGGAVKNSYWWSLCSSYPTPMPNIRPIYRLLLDFDRFDKKKKGSRSNPY